MKTEHLLIMRLSAMGDVAMLVPVTFSLARQYPNLRITVLSKPFARPFFENISDNVGFMETDINGEESGLHGLNVLYRRLSAKHFTAVADMHDVLRTKYLRMRFTIDQYRVEHIDKHRTDRQRLCRLGYKGMSPLPSAFDNYADVLARLGYPIECSFRSIFPEQRGEIRSLAPAIPEKKSFQQWIGIAPFAAHTGKIYPPDKMETVIDIITQRHPNSRIFLFGGGRKEQEIMNGWAEKNKQCICVAGTLKGLDKELSLMSYLDVMVSMDSANMHLASLVATPVVSVWGATHPCAGFMGWGQSEENAVQVDLPCRPCSVFGKKECHRGDYACLNRIEPVEIADKVESILMRK